MAENGANVKTRTSAQKEWVEKQTIIRFLEPPPRYRKNPVDLTNGNVLRLFGIKRLRGRNENRLRAFVRHENWPKPHAVIIEGRDFEVEVSYTGEVNKWIEDVP
jgi:hypothetical protein